MMTEKKRRGPGRPRIYDGQGAPKLSLRLAPDLMEWVRAQGGTDFIRELLERERAREVESSSA